MAIQTYSIDKEIAEKFKAQTPDQKTSAKLEELMAEYIDEDVEEKKQPLKLTDPAVVSKKRRKLFRNIVEKNWLGKQKSQIFSKIRGTGMYSGDSGKYHFKQAMKFLLKLDDVPIMSENDKIVAEEFICMNEGCDAGLTAHVLRKNDFKCLSCGRRYEV